MKIKHPLYVLTIFTLGTLVHSSCAQGGQPKLIGSCEGCEAIFEYGDKKLNSVDTLPGFKEATTKIKITGTVYQPDGKTPAEGVILYVYHTNEDGIYPTKGGEKDWSRRHGNIRGWMKTGDDGRYTFYTLQPGTYPSRTDPAHIHPTILEPDGKYYWVDEYLFEGDPLLTKQHLSTGTPVGGSSGILQLKKEGDLLVGERNFVLGKNVAGYGK